MYPVALDHRFQANRDAAGGAASAGSGPFFFQELLALLRRPQRILFLWNWKSAWLSLALRAPIFAVAALQRGFFAALSAVLTESVVCMVTAGFYGAIAQNLLNAKPAWLTLLFLTSVVPAVFQAVEFLLHLLRGTPHLRMAEILSIFVSGISGLFNWYAMRRGALLVGGQGGSFASDIKRLPGLLVRFVAVLPAWVKERKRLTANHSRIRQG
jgi:hypothetical protein